MAASLLLRRPLVLVTVVVVTIKAVRGAARLKKRMWEKRRRTKRLTKVDNAIGISRPGDGLWLHFKVATL